jgi:hypothetical protein
VDKDSKKQEMFKKGLTPELRTLLTPQIYPDFNTLMNMAILIERARAEEKKENKRKFMEHKAKQQERSQRQRSFGHPVSRFQAPMQYRTQSQATGSQGPRTQFKPYNNQNTMKPPQSNTSQVTANNNNSSLFQLPRDWTLHCQLPICQEANILSLLQLGEWAKATRI